MNTSLYGGLIEISPDGQPITPDLVLSYRGGTKQGIIHNVQSLTNANALVETAEISFDVYKEIDGVECQLWDDIRDALDLLMKSYQWIHQFGCKQSLDRAL